MPLLSYNELMQSVVGGKIGAVSIDTSIFEQYQFGFETGVLTQLSQFARLDVDHVIVDMVQHEMRTHLVVQANLHRAHTKNALKPLGNSWGLSKDVRDEVITSLFGSQTGLQRVDERLEAFFHDTSATLIKGADFAKLSDVVERYFSVAPPFGDREAKKHEFPDAVALLALEGWAAKIGKQVLVVANDGDWKRFCSESASLCYIADLPQALSLFHAGADVAVQLFRKTVAEGAIPDFDAAVVEALNAQADKIEVDFEGHAAWYYEAELTRVEIDSSGTPISEQLAELEVIDYENNQLLVRANLNCSVTAQFVVSFQAWDGIDKEYLGMGSTTIDQAVSMDLEVLLTILFENGIPLLEQVELIPTGTTMDFGEIEPDWMDDDEP